MWGKIVRTHVNDFYNLVFSESDKSKNNLKVKDYEIMTDIGWIDITSIREDIIKEKITTVTTENFILHAVPEQIFIVDESKKKEKLDKIKNGDFISTELGLEEVLDVTKKTQDVEVYDLKVKMGNPSVFIAGFELAEGDDGEFSIHAPIIVDVVSEDDKIKIKKQ